MEVVALVLTGVGIGVVGACVALMQAGLHSLMTGTSSWLQRRLWRRRGDQEQLSSEYLRAKRGALLSQAFAFTALTLIHLVNLWAPKPVDQVLVVVLLVAVGCSVVPFAIFEGRAARYRIRDKQNVPLNRGGTGSKDRPLP